ncbi:secondary thiamine-phosphate synthase enzyme [Ereboglobus sp. PH5-10]|uniref:secondary thiamine-phosphate synthase enzyme YjbQ n=1 Tax=Ereboglobus sp. PH5-10 TaxID=2940629 RepID=UPI0024077153|nr:secondary thiamine-phosphate synthase enzyme YjbQ [Ereboglobus sp. PH5-10]MDF9826690.1 secondary thiamine-phosphate synthase enzyme [Ereboglobus sp. PH5-10]
MPVHHATFTIHTRSQGLHEITGQLEREVARSGIASGVATVFCRHTSASLVIMENADPSARADLEAWLNRLVPERDPHFTHTFEGSDDMPSHIKTALTRTSETVPLKNGRLLLGTWQGVYLWEHRREPHTREVLLTVLGEQALQNA